jgi:predicted dehydrogenase
MKKDNMNSQRDRSMSRRRFMGTAAGAAAGFIIVPRHVLGGAGQIPPSEKVNIASIGAGGQAEANIPNCAKVANIVALCDVDEENAALMYKAFPKVPKYRDYRVMLEKQKDIDAVLVITPDHSHAPATMAAMKLGKAVYTQKPLTRTIFEARTLTETARKTGVMT